MADPETSHNWRRLDDRITTSGQPTEQQLANIQALGVRHIINLGLHTHEKALPDEAASVGGLGMTYIHIPVNFQNPTDEDFAEFLCCDGAVKGGAGSRSLHRQLPGLGLLLSISPGCARNERGRGARRDGTGLAPRGRLGDVYRSFVLSSLRRPRERHESQTCAAPFPLGCLQRRRRGRQGRRRRPVRLRSRPLAADRGDPRGGAFADPHRPPDGARGLAGAVGQERAAPGRGREPFVPVGWERALDLVAGELARVRREHGPAAIMGGSQGWSSAGIFTRRAANCAGFSPPPAASSTRPAITASAPR